MPKMKASVLPAMLIFAASAVGTAQAQSTSKIVTPPAAAESARSTSDAVSGTMKDAMKSGEASKEMKEMKEMKEKAKEAEGAMKKEKMK